jgi:hypothetical protein
MTIPNDPAQRAAVLADYIAAVEANSTRRAFSASNYALLDGDPEVAQMGTLLGCGCEYAFWQLDDGLTLTTVNDSGPWPHASVSWVFDEPRRYEEAVLRAVLTDGLMGGGKPEEFRAMIARTMAEVMPSDQ